MSTATAGKNEAEVRTAYKRIRLREQHPRVASEIAREHGLNPVAARVLAARGYTLDETLEHYLDPTLKRGLPKPQKLKNLGKACKLIGEIISAGGGIAICCDFDVDGLSGGSQVYHCLKSIGVKTEVFVPDRFKEGYGLNCDMIRKIADSGYSLIITIDFGTTNTQEIELARELGLRTIVLDHHHVGESGAPPADVFVNPQQKGCGFADGILAAAGLAWYLVAGIRAVVKEAAKVNPKEYLDLACLGTICDMVPLIGANRIIARRGLEMLERTNRSGLIALKNVIGVRNGVRCSHVSFGIGPRLNAAGRMVHGEMVIDLLAGDDSRKADKLAKKLNRLNLERQDTEKDILEQAKALVSHFGYLPPALVVWGEHFHTGVIGIVAQRLVEAYYRPSVVMGMEEGTFKGSVRGIKGFNVVKALEACGKYLLKFGGHEGAGGFSIEPKYLEDFRDAFSKECERQCEGLELEPYAEADTTATLRELDIDLVNAIKGFEPFGVGNPGPQVLLENLRVQDVKLLKGAHTKVMLSDGKLTIPGLMWRETAHPALYPGAKVNVVCKPDVNSFNGRTEIQVTLQAVEEVS